MGRWEKGPIREFLQALDVWREVLAALPAFLGCPGSGALVECGRFLEVVIRGVLLEDKLVSLLGRKKNGVRGRRDHLEQQVVARQAALIVDNRLSFEHRALLLAREAHVLDQLVCDGVLLDMAVILSGCLAGLLTIADLPGNVSG